MSFGTHDSEPSTSTSLLYRAREGDGDSWRRLAQVYGPVVYAWARRSGCQSADAADVMQETFASVAKAIGGFDYSKPGSTFRGWLWTITRNKIRDRARAAGLTAAGGTEANLKMQQVAGEEPLVDSELGDPQLVDSPVESELPPGDETSDIASVRRRTIELMRESFDPRSWRMFWETAVEGREPAAVADEMGVSRWAVYKARARVLHRLQQEMQGLD